MDLLRCFLPEAILHIFWMMGGGGDAPARLGSVLRLAGSVVAFTTDMGTEMGLADVHVPSMKAALPPWLFPAAHGARVLPVDGDADGGDEGLDAAAGSRRAFPVALVSPGMLHIIHNLSLRMDRHMAYWSDWLSGLQSLVTLLHYREHRELFINRCVRGTAFDHRRSGLHAGVPTTTEWRWNTVQAIVDKLLPLKTALQTTFRASLMGGCEQHEDEEEDAHRDKVGKLNPAKVQATVRSSFWWSFTVMISMLHRVLTNFQQWVEGCVCHFLPNLVLKEQIQEWVQQCRRFGTSEHDGPFFQCPMAGLRGPELASCEWISVFDEIAAACLESTLAGCDGVDMDEIGPIAADFEEGKKQVYGQLQLKLQCWSCLPWKFAGLGHYDAVTALRVGREIQQAWSAMSPCDKQADKQHPLTIRILTTEPLAGEFLQFVSGESDLKELPSLWLEVCRLRFIPVTERCCEAKHSLAHVMGIYRNVSPSYVSLHLRLPEWEKAVKRKPEVVLETLDHFQETRKRRRLAPLLGLAAHPGISEVVALGRSSSIRLKATAAVMYGDDPSSKFAKLEAAQAANKKEVDRRARARKPLDGAGAGAPSWARLLQNCQHQHLKQIAVPGRVYSMPLSAFDGADAAQAWRLSDKMQVGGEAVHPRDLQQDDQFLGSAVADDAGMEVITIGAAPAMAAGARLVFSVVEANPSKARIVPLPPGVARRLGPSDVQIAMHTDFAESLEGGEGMISVAPTRILQNPVLILSRLGTAISASPEDLMCWVVRNGMQYALHGLPFDRHMVSLISRMVTSRATPSSGLTFTNNSAENPDDTRELNRLAALGYTTCSSEYGLYSQWRLTQMAMRALQSCRTIHSPQPALKDRGLPISAKSSYELLLALQKDGWVWQLLRRRRPLAAYVVGGPKIFATTGVTLPRSYACCLLQAAALQDAGEAEPLAVEHGRHEAYYNNLLKQRPWVARAAAAAAASMPVQEGRLVTIVVEADDGGEVMAADEEVAGDAEEDVPEHGLAMSGFHGQ